jgi:hypothetical protein
MNKSLALAVSAVVGAVLLVVSGMVPVVNYCCFIWGLIIGFLMVVLYSLLCRERPVGFGTVAVICLTASVLAVAVYMALAFMGSVAYGLGMGKLMGEMGLGAVSGVMVFVMAGFFGLVMCALWFVTSAIGGVVAAVLTGRK